MQVSAHLNIYLNISFIVTIHNTYFILFLNSLIGFQHIKSHVERHQTICTRSLILSKSSFCQQNIFTRNFSFLDCVEAILQTTLVTFNDTGDTTYFL